MPDSPLKANQCAIEMDRNEVRVTVMCADRYAAIELHDAMMEGCRQGFLLLHMDLERKPE